VGVLPFAMLLPALALDALWQAKPYRRVAQGLALLAVVVGLGLTVRDYFGRYVRNADTRYLFQSAARELAETANVYLAGDAARQVWLDRRLWDSFTSVQFLLMPDERLRLYDAVPAALSAPARVVAWPYEDLRGPVSAQPAGAIITPERGPLYRGDLEPAAYALYAAYTAEPCAAATCPATPLAEFEGGWQLLTADLQPAVWGLTATLTWRAPDALGRDVQVAALAYVQNADGSEALAAQADGPLGTELFPSAWWRAGETVRETRALDLSGETGETIVVRVGLYNPVTQTRFPRVDDPSEFVELVLRP
jgi:hypothetical protein